MSDRPRIALDLVPIHAGRGGAGGGIWSYAASLAAALDELAPTDVEIVCLTNPEQRLALRHLRQIVLPVDTRGARARLHWIHRALPTWCRQHDVAVLHKLASEVPWVLPRRMPLRTRLVTTVQDFVTEFQRERHAVVGGTPAARLHRAYFMAATRRAFATSDVVLTTTETIAADARRRFPRAAARIRTVPLGVAHEAFARMGDTHAGDATGPRVLAVGVFLPHKGQDAAVAAFTRFVARFPDVAHDASLTLRGHVVDASYHAAVRAAAAASPAAARISFAAYDPAARPADLYAAADVLLLLSAYEGFGLPPLEAQVAGLPVVCTDLPVLREVLGRGACFVPRDDPDAVADALHRVTTDAALRTDLVRHGRENARRFSWARTARETLDVYRSVTRPD